jgi:hypothetical protein
VPRTWPDSISVAARCGRRYWCWVLPLLFASWVGSFQAWTYPCWWPWRPVIRKYRWTRFSNAYWWCIWDSCTFHRIRPLPGLGWYWTHSSLGIPVSVVQRNIVSNFPAFSSFRCGRHTRIGRFIGSLPRSLSRRRWSKSKTFITFFSIHLFDPWHLYKKYQMNLIDS